MYCFKEDHETMWGARALYNNGELTVLPDRQEVVRGPDFDELINAINGNLTKKFRELIRNERPRSDSYEIFKIVEGRVTIMGSPNGSYGYMYIIAFISKEKELKNNDN